MSPADAAERWGRRAKPRLSIIDTQAVKCIPVRGPRGYDANKKVLGRKRVALVDAEGTWLAVAVVPASVQDRDTLERISALAIPPAWTDVWICPDDRGHLQAVGSDDAGRRQYLYHPKWAELRSREKYARMLEFAQALPQLREQVEDLLDPDAPDAGVPTRDRVALRRKVADEPPPEPVAEGPWSAGRAGANPSDPDA